MDRNCVKWVHQQYAVIQRTNKPGQLRQYTLFTNLGLGRVESSTATKARKDSISDNAILFDLEKHAAILLALVKREPSLVVQLAGELAPTQPKFWDFTYDLLGEFPSDARLRAALIGLFDERGGWGYYSERLLNGLSTIESARKQKNVPAHAMLFLEEARNALMRRRDEALAREESSGRP